jgi:hypothetical protein
MNGIPKAIVENSSIVRLAPANVHERRIRNGSNGSATRDSITANTPNKTAAPSSRPSVCGSPHPAFGASTTA